MRQQLINKKQSSTHTVAHEQKEERFENEDLLASLIRKGNSLSQGILLVQQEEISIISCKAYAFMYM